MPKVIRPFRPAAKVSDRERLLLLEVRQQVTRLLKVSGIRDMLELIRGRKGGDHYQVQSNSCED